MMMMMMPTVSIALLEADPLAFYESLTTTHQLLITWRLQHLLSMINI